MRESPSLDVMGPRETHFIETLFADGLEGFREPGGIPLDLVVGGVVARKA